MANANIPDVMYTAGKILYWDNIIKKIHLGNIPDWFRIKQEVRIKEGRCNFRNCIFQNFHRALCASMAQKLEYRRYNVWLSGLGD
jgi:hypothetical protein